MRRKKSGVLAALRGLLMPLGALAVLLFFFTALSNLDQGRGCPGQAAAGRRPAPAAVACYAAEGVYPPDLAYLEEHYGIQIDRTRYRVFYDIFGSNLMPDITVLEYES